MVIITFYAARSVETTRTRLMLKNDGHEPSRPPRARSYGGNAAGASHPVKLTGASAILGWRASVAVLFGFDTLETASCAL